jgi:pyruvate dehydrogenase E2 component (dihydrolipoamide acetyltransferase)
MAEVTMPKMGFDMTEGTIVRWLKKVGDEVKKGEPIAEIETDKVTIEIESFSSGTLTQIVAEEGAVVAVGAPIAILGDDGQVASSGDGSAAPAAESTAAAGATSGAQTEAAGRLPADRDREQGVSTASDAAQQTEAAAGSASGAASGAASDAPRQGYGSDVTAQQEVTGGPAPSGSTPTASGAQMQPATTQANGGHVPASPVAKRLARENNVNITQVSGSGPGGRIVRRDVEEFVRSGGSKAAPAAQPTQPAQPTAQPTQAAQPAQPAAQQPELRPGTRREPMSRLRQTIARRLVQSKAPVPHFYVTTEIDMGAALELRKQLNASGDVKITVNDLIVKAAAIAIKKFPALNASFAEDSLDYHDYVNVSIAIATDNGLLAPAITDVDKKSLGTISAEAKDLAERTRNGKATPDELQRGTFSVSNMGMYSAVESFVAIINPPQSMILAVGAVKELPVVRDGQIAIGQIMKVTISIDHRVSDGAVGAQYMAELKRLLENPMLILL